MNDGSAFQSRLFLKISKNHWRAKRGIWTIDIWRAFGIQDAVLLIYCIHSNLKPSTKHFYYKFIWFVGWMDGKQTESESSGCGQQQHAVEWRIQNALILIIQNIFLRNFFLYRECGWILLDKQWDRERKYLFDCFVIIFVRRQKTIDLSISVLYSNFIFSPSVI